MEPRVQAFVMLSLPFVASPAIVSKFSARMSKLNSMRILWVKAGGLVPPDTGGKIRSYNILRELARRHSVTFFSYYGAVPTDTHPELKSIFDAVVCVPLHLPTPKSLAESLEYAMR